MAYYHNDAEISTALKNMTIIADTREQVNKHIIDFLEKNKIFNKTRKLDTGDYSAMLGDATLENEIVIERKNSIDEIAGNFTADRPRFEAEFTRAKANGTKVFLLIENASWTDIFCHCYRSQIEPKALVASLMTWQVRYNVTIIFCKSSESGQVIFNILYYWFRDKLKKGEI